MTDSRYEHFSKGDIVRLKESARRDCPAHDRLPTVGIVRDVTNAGFRGLEYSGLSDEGEHWFGLSAADLELVAPTPGHPIPWYRQGTYRDGKKVGA